MEDLVVEDVLSLQMTSSSSSLPEAQFEEYYEEHVPIINTVIAITGYMLYAVAIVLGIPFNVFVLARMFKLARKCQDLYNNGVGICLFIMAISDIVSLSMITIHIFFSVQTHDTLSWFSDAAMNGICKVVVFSMHVSTSLSIWSWLLMSVLRYLSVYHPLVYIRLWQMPPKALGAAFVVSVLENLWLLLSVINSSDNLIDGGCTQLPVFEREIINRSMLLLDSFWSFIIPCCIIIFVDVSVFWSSIQFKHRKQRKGFRFAGHGKITRHSSLLPRWLLIAMVDLALNAPECVLRLLVILGIVESDDGHNGGYLMIRQFTQGLYFFQFGFNSVYLALFIFDKSTRPSTRRVHSNSHEMVEAAVSPKYERGHSPSIPTFKTSIITQDTARTSLSLDYGTPGLPRDQFDYLSVIQSLDTVAEERRESGITVDGSVVEHLLTV